MVRATKALGPVQHSSVRVGQVQLIAGCVALIVAIASCGSSQPPGVKTDVESAIGRAAMATSLYSFNYYGGVRTLYVQLPAYDPAVTCASFTASGGSQYSDVWYLGLYVEWSTPVTAAPIGTVFPPSTGSAYLDVVHAKAGSPPPWLVSALGGTVQFTAAPQSEADQIAGVQVRGHLAFTLPNQPKARTSCSGGVSAADGGGNQTCMCVDLAGNTSTCAAGPNENCCATVTADVEPFALDVTANACGFFCVTTPGDPNNCAELTAGT